MKDIMKIIALLAIVAIILAIYYGIAVSDLPEWFKFALLK